ncbi:hypothetical protein Asp14428_32950 [Actinoplanes sp. NBRC 14428]|nr:hypothetical protein Asp14428_32950 [Actinoplanes sp. NBRC 14428]
MFVTDGQARAVPPPMRLDPKAVLPLHVELYLLAHDDDTGNLLINPQALAYGLAGALLLELSQRGYVAVGYAYHNFRDEWQPRPGRLTVCRTGTTGSAPLDAALAAVEQTLRTQHSGDQLRTWLRDYAATDLYQRVRAELVAVGLIQRTERRRLAGLVKTETHLPVHHGYAVRARAHIRDAVLYHARRNRPRHAAPDDVCTALCGLVAALELTEFLYDATPTRELTHRLWHVVNHRENLSITAVVQAVDAGRGDLAVAAMR